MYLRLGNQKIKSINHKQKYLSFLPPKNIFYMPVYKKTPK